MISNLQTEETYSDAEIEDMDLRLNLGRAWAAVVAQDEAINQRYVGRKFRIVYLENSQNRHLAGQEYVVEKIDITKEGPKIYGYDCRMVFDLTEIEFI